MVSPSIFQFVIHVFEDPSKIGDINQTFLTLIPKVSEPTKPSDFRPIALCNVIYKIVTKVLSNHIKSFLPYIISQNQASFITGRSTTDNAIILSETIHSMNLMAGRKRYTVIKLDLAKAHNKMEWSFIKESLDILQFPPHITKLIYERMSSLAFSINWQSRSSQRFYPSRGLRRGDPLSPLLFVIALERLSHCI